MIAPDYPDAKHKIKQLIRRLEAIAASLSRRPTALALIGLGSSGLERTRLDEYSDLDFFVAVSPGSKAAYLENLDWLSEIYPVAYVFRNTPDGYKLLFADDIFCEFAIFEPAELEKIPFTAAKILWSREPLPEIELLPGIEIGLPARPNASWLVGEALTNLYVGLLRMLRGERLSAFKFIQGYAVDRLLELASLEGPKVNDLGDPFAIERRFEQRFPELSAKLPDFLPGYSRSAAAAEAILVFLESHWEVNAAMASRIRAMCARLRASAG